MQQIVPEWEAWCRQSFTVWLLFPRLPPRIVQTYASSCRHSIHDNNDN